MANRFFAFGCSFTKHSWPTWAHCSAELHRRMGIVDYTYNFGVSGASNKLIAHTVMLAHSVHNIDSDDVVYIMWTTADRTDCWGVHGQSHSGWKPMGSIHHSDMLPKTIKQTYTPQGFYTDTLLYQRMIREILPNAVHCAWRGDHEVNILNNWCDPANPHHSVPQWGAKHLRAVLESDVNTANHNQQYIGTDFLRSDRKPGHKPFLATDTLIDQHPHPQAHFDCAVRTFCRGFTGGALRSAQFNRVVKSVGSDIVKYTNAVNKQHTDAYTQLHTASGETPVLYRDNAEQHCVTNTDAHTQFVSEAEGGSPYYAVFDGENSRTELNYDMCPVPGVNHRGMHRNTYGDLWYDSTHSEQDMLNTQDLFGIDYDALADELYEEWCDALYPKLGS